MIRQLLQQYKRVVVDFSFLANMRSQEMRHDFINTLLEEDCEVAVSQDFFENCEVVRQSHFEEQEELIRRIEEFTETLRQKKKFFMFENAYSPESVVSALAPNPKVCFAFHCISEFAETVLADLEKVKAVLLMTDCDGEVRCPESREEILGLLRPEVDPDIRKKGVVIVSEVIGKGSVVMTREKELITLGEQIGRGGEGSVFHSDYRGAFGKGYVVKIYHKGKLNALRLKKLRRMESAMIRYEGICWPEKMVFSQEGKPVGYLMQGISGKNMASVFTGPDRVQETFPAWTRQDLIRLAVRILQRYQYLHIFGILIGDMRMKNIVLSEDGFPNIMDTDSAQVGRIPCPVGFEDFTPPELQGVPFEEQLRTYENENFSVAVLIFMILFFGRHPYDQKHGADDITEDIRDARFPYPERGSADYSRIPWGGYDAVWKNMPVPFQQFFRDVFREQKRSSLIEMICLLKTYDRFIAKTKDSYPAVNQLIYEEDEVNESV